MALKPEPAYAGSAGRPSNGRAREVPEGAPVLRIPLGKDDVDERIKE